MLSLTILILLGCSGVIQGYPVVGPQIVNGTNATQGEFPFMVSVRNLGGSHTCGGSVIAPQWVLTAAHCMESGNPRLIYYGNVSLNEGSLAEELLKVKVVEQIVHPNYTIDDSPTKLFIRNDLALLKLEYSLNFSGLVQPIGLPEQDELVPINQTATLTGWGMLSDDVFEAETLQKVNLTIFDYPYCDQYNEVYNFDNTQNICAGNSDNTKGQCNGDSGGPLFRDGVQWGIVSWSIKPCISAPGVFTRTSGYIDWIKNVTGI